MFVGGSQETEAARSVVNFLNKILLAPHADFRNPIEACVAADGKALTSEVLYAICEKAQASLITNLADLMYALAFNFQVTSFTNVVIITSA
jgi:hypothetical protein